MWTVGRKIAVGFALAFLLLLVIGGFSYRSIGALTQTSYAVAHSHEVLDKLSAVIAVVAETEGQYRGYVITSNEQYVPDFEAARRSVPELESQLRALVKDNPLQLKNAEEVIQTTDDKIEFAVKAFEIFKREGRDAAARWVQTGRGKILMDELRRRASRLETEERRLLTVRAEEVEAAASETRQAILIGTLLCLAVITGAGFLLTRSLTREIASAVQHVQRSSNELQSAATQQAAGAREAATSMNEISTTIAELLTTSRQIAESAQQVADVAQRTANASRRGDGTVQLARESIEGIRKQVDMVVDHMLDLGRKSQQIGAVLEIVSELAEQTNILAINATIEATGAGEMGKRFGVVADEIRKLADRVAGSTKEIRGLIEDVRGAVNTTVMATETGSKAVDLGTRQFGEVAAAFTEITGLVGATTDAAREIGLSTKQQTSAVEQVNLAIAATAQATRETETSSGQTFQTASQLAGLSRNLMRLVQPQALAA